MRISTNFISQLSLEAMLKQQTELAKTQQQVATGKRFASPSEDPIGAVKILDLQRQESLSAQYINNAVVAERRLNNKESILTNVTDVLQRIRELAIQGLNDTLGGPARRGIAEEMDQLKNALVTLSNSRDVNGEYIFAGYASDQPAYAFDTDLNRFVYQGDTGERHLKIGENFSVSINEPGNRIFQADPSDPDSATLFDRVGAFADALRNNTIGTAPNDAAFLQDMDSYLSAAFEARTRNGSLLVAVDQQKLINDSLRFSVQTTLSQIQDLDYAEAITRLNLQSVGLQAAQQSYVKVQSLSLFNFL